MHVYFFIAGHSVKPWQLDTNLIKEEDKAILRRIQTTLEEKTCGLKCGKHREEITAIVSGPSCQQLGVEIKGCCSDFVHIVSKSLELPDVEWSSLRSAH